MVLVVVFRFGKREVVDAVEAAICLHMHVRFTPRHGSAVYPSILFDGTLHESWCGENRPLLLILLQELPPELVRLFVLLNPQPVAAFYRMASFGLRENLM